MYHKTPSHSRNCSLHRSFPESSYKKVSSQNTSRMLEISYLFFSFTAPFFHRDEICFVNLALISGRQMDTCVNTVSIFLVAITKKERTEFRYILFSLYLPFITTGIDWNYICNTISIPIVLITNCATKTCLKSQSLTF